MQTHVKGPMKLTSISIIRVPLPAIIEGALNYRGNRRYIAYFKRQQQEPHLQWCDGMDTGDVDSHVWEFYVSHPKIFRYLNPFLTEDFGPRENGCLVLDRKIRSFTFCDKETAYTMANSHTRFFSRGLPPNPHMLSLAGKAIKQSNFSIPSSGYPETTWEYCSLLSYYLESQ